MGETKRKRGRKPKTATDEETVSQDFNTASKNDVVSLPTTTTDAAETSDPDSQGRRQGRSKKVKKKKKKITAVVSERRSSRFTDLNGECAATVELPMMPKWEGVVKVVPSMDVVVKVFCVHTEPNFSLPWQRKRQYSSSSSGFIVSGRRVLMNAHSVEHHTQQC